MEDNNLRRGVINLIYFLITTEHPGVTKTYVLVVQQFWWPGIKDFITKYI